MPVARSIPNIDHRFGNGEAEILGVELLDRKSDSISEAVGGQEIVIRVSSELLNKRIRRGYKADDGC